MTMEEIKEGSKTDVEHYSNVIASARKQLDDVECVLSDVKSCSSQYSKKVLYALLTKLMVNVQAFVAQSTDINKK